MLPVNSRFPLTMNMHWKMALASYFKAKIYDLVRSRAHLLQHLDAWQ